MKVDCPANLGFWLELLTLMCLDSGVFASKLSGTEDNKITDITEQVM
jgi:hypothetical protein